MSENKILKNIGSEIWLAEGGPVSFFGFPYPTRMVIVRLKNKKLWIWSPIHLDKDLIKEVEELGEVKFIVSPNKIHHLFMGEWNAKWPKAVLVASPGLKKRRKDLKFGLELTDKPDQNWSDEINQVIVRGSLFLEEAWFFHKKSRTLMVCDMIQRFDPREMHGFAGLMMKLDGLVGDRGSTPREWRLSFWPRKKARRAVKTALRWDFQQLIIAHGKCAWENAVEVVKTSLKWLKV